MYDSQARFPPWTVRAWPPLLWQLSGHDPLQLQHLCTQITQPGFTSASHVIGQTLWAAQCAEGEAALAWDWVQLDEGVFVMADPMGVVTNLRLVDDTGEVLGTAQAAMHINVMLRALPWQETVGREIVHKQRSERTERQDRTERPRPWLSTAGASAGAEELRPQH